jgi:hypothetical protein
VDPYNLLLQQMGSRRRSWGPALGPKSGDFRAQAPGFGPGESPKGHWPGLGPARASPAPESPPECGASKIQPPIAWVEGLRANSRLGRPACRPAVWVIGAGCGKRRQGHFLPLGPPGSGQVAGACLALGWAAPGASALPCACTRGNGEEVPIHVPRGVGMSGAWRWWWVVVDGKPAQVLTRVRHSPEAVRGGPHHEVLFRTVLC